MYREGIDGAPRFTMLKPLREFAREHLTDAETCAARHAAYYRAFAQQARAHFQTSEQKAWLDRVEEEHANLRAARAWLFARGDGDAFMQIAGALELFWYWRGYWGEARRWLEQLLASQVPLSLAARAKAQDELGGFL
jgi:predicted ATPase